MNTIHDDTQYLPLQACHTEPIVLAAWRRGLVHHLAICPDAWPHLRAALDARKVLYLGVTISCPDRVLVYADCSLPRGFGPASTQVSDLPSTLRTWLRLRRPSEISMAARLYDDVTQAGRHIDVSPCVARG